jgi:histidinol phosphatase-like PHP family hydrolase
MTKQLFFAIAIIFSLLAMNCQGHGVLPASESMDQKRLIQFPDTKAYKTLILDPHTHSTFSDGHVWPTIRIAEALKDGLDAIAITEHLEWQPHLADIPHQDRNRSYNIAVDANGTNELMVISGAEITRNAPAGHINALFLQDANLLFKDELLTASLEICAAFYAEKSQILRLEISNHSDADFQPQNKSQYTFTDSTDFLSIKPHGTRTIGVKTGNRVKQISLQFEVLNALVKPKQTAQLTLSSRVESRD